MNFICLLYRMLLGFLKDAAWVFWVSMNFSEKWDIWNLCDPEQLNQVPPSLSFFISYTEMEIPIGRITIQIKNTIYKLCLAHSCLNKL